MNKSISPAALCWALAVAALMAQTARLHWERQAHQDLKTAVAIDHAGQYGCAAWRASPMLRAYLRRDYTAACRGYLSYRYITSNNKEGAGWRAYQAAGRTRYKYDCATPGNRVCRGVWLRSQERHSQCLAALEGA